MSQAWLQVAGIIVEFIGVLLISWEWFTAQRQEQTERAFEAAHLARQPVVARPRQQHRGDRPFSQRRRHRLAGDAQRPRLRRHVVMQKLRPRAGEHQRGRH